jgi:hypothetical protein
MKRGELSSQQIVTIVILILAFSIILFFFANLGLKEEVTKETCRNSVSLRGTSLGKNVILNCKTQDVCLSAGGDCAKAGKNSVKIKINNEEELKEELANLMYECWYQMGEGKVDYLPANFGSKKNYCALCNRIYLDNKLSNEKYSSISVKEFYTYLADKKTPDGTQTLLNYFYGVNSVDSAFESMKGSFDIDKAKFEFGSKEGYALITSLAKNGYGETLISGIGTYAGVTLVAVSLASFGTGGIVLATAYSAGTVISGTGFASIASGIAFWKTGPGDTIAMPPSFYEYKEEDLKKIGCYEFSTLP